MKSTRSAAFFISYLIKVTVNNIITDAKKSHSLLGHETKVTTSNERDSCTQGTYEAIASWTSWVCVAVLWAVDHLTIGDRNSHIEEDIGSQAVNSKWCFVVYLWIYGRRILGTQGFIFISKWNQAHEK